MKTIYYILITFLFFVLSFSADAQSRKERMKRFTSTNSYEVQCIGVGKDGTKSIKVWSYGKSVKKALYKIKKDAVAAAIFRGIPAGGGAAMTPPIMTSSNARDEYSKFFKKFFKSGGSYLNFVNVSDERKPIGSNRIKMKGGYKVGMLVSINFDHLRKYLEEKGIAKKLNNGF